MKKIHLRLITPMGIKIEQDADMVVMRSITGDVGVLPSHDPYSVALADGIMRITAGAMERRIAIYGGLATVQQNVLTVLVNDAEWPEEIDRARADADREHAERRLQERTDDLEISEDQVLLRRALMRIEVSSNPHLETDDNEGEV